MRSGSTRPPPTYHATRGTGAAPGRVQGLARLRLGLGTPGAVAGGEHYLVVRRNRTTSELAFCRAGHWHRPACTPWPRWPAPAGRSKPAFSPMTPAPHPGTRLPRRRKGLCRRGDAPGGRHRAVPSGPTVPQRVQSSSPALGDAGGIRGRRCRQPGRSGSGLGSCSMVPAHGHMADRIMINKAGLACFRS